MLFEIILAQERSCNNAKELLCGVLQTAMMGNLAPSTDSDLEAFSRDPTDGSFVAIAFQLATFTKYLNEVFLSY